MSGKGDGDTDRPSLPRFVLVCSMLSLVLLWPAAFLCRTLLALYVPWARIWLALAVAIFSILVYGVRLAPSLAKFHLSSLPPFHQIAAIAVLDALQNISLMIGSGCVPAPVSSLIPLMHVHLRHRPDSYIPAALTVVGFGVLIIVTREHARFFPVAIICMSPVFMAISTKRRIALLDASTLPGSFMLQLLSSLLQVPIWIVVYPVTSRIQSAVLPLETHSHPVSSALFVQHDPVYIGAVSAVLLLLVVNFVVVWRFRASSIPDIANGSQPWVQYASRGADLVLAPVSPQHVEAAMVAGAAAAFALAGLMVPQRSHLPWLCAGAVLILTASAIQLQSSFRFVSTSPVVEEYDLPLVA